MDAADQPRPAPRPTGFTLGLTWFGYAAILLGLLAGLNRLFGLELGVKGWTLPADGRIAALGLAGGGLFAVLGRFLERPAYRRLRAGRPWLPWLIGTLLPLLALAAIFWAVGGL